MSNWKPGKAFFAAVERTRRDDIKRRVEREFKESGATTIPTDATRQDISDIMDVGMELLMESRAKLMKLFKAHDYYYEYSDDGRVWRQGTAEKRKITDLMKELNCTFKMTELYGYISGYITEDMVTYKDGWAKAGDEQRWKENGWNIAPVCEFHLVPRERYNEIARFFGEEESFDRLEG